MATVKRASVSSSPQVHMYTEVQRQTQALGALDRLLIPLHSEHTLEGTVSSTPPNPKGSGDCLLRLKKYFKSKARRGGVCL